MALPAEVGAFQLAHEVCGDPVVELVKFIDDLKCPASIEDVASDE